MASRDIHLSQSDDDCPCNNACGTKPFYSLEKIPQMMGIVELLPRVWHEVLLKDELEWHDWGAEHRKVLDGKWDICNIYRKDTKAAGRKSKPLPDMPREQLKRWIASCREAPKTFPVCWKIFETLPLINFVGLSRLGPRSRLKTHKHDNPNSLVCHVGMFIPRGDVGLKVGCQERHWASHGQVMVFDDSVPHSCWNETDQDRIVLHIDFEKPRCL